MPSRARALVFGERRGGEAAYFQRREHVLHLLVFLDVDDFFNVFHYVAIVGEVELLLVLVCALGVLVARTNQLVSVGVRDGEALGGKPLCQRECSAQLLKAPLLRLKLQHAPETMRARVALMMGRAPGPIFWCGEQWWEGGSCVWFQTKAG